MYLLRYLLQLLLQLFINISTMFTHFPVVNVVIVDFVIELIFYIINYFYRICSYSIHSWPFLPSSPLQASSPDRLDRRSHGHRRQIRPGGSVWPACRERYRGELQKLLVGWHAVRREPSGTRTYGERKGGKGTRVWGEERGKGMRERYMVRRKGKGEKYMVRAKSI